MTDHDNLGLSDEELAALEGDDEDMAPVDEDADDEADEPEQQAAPEDEPSDDAEAPADEPDADPEPVIEAKEFEPKWMPEPVADFDKRMADLEAAKKDLRDKYREGDLDLDEYEAQRDKVETDILALRESKLKADIANEQQQQAMAQRWQWEIERFLSQKENAIYRADAPNSRNAELDAVVRMLGNNPAHSDKPMAWFLEEADKWVRARYDETPKAQAAKPKGKALIPPSVASMPSADLGEVDGDEFANIDKLSGLDIERAIARMSDSELDRYLRGH